jgi:hypothetical protein
MERPVGGQPNDLFVPGRPEPPGVQPGLVGGDVQVAEGRPGGGTVKGGPTALRGVTERDDVGEPVFLAETPVEDPKAGETEKSPPVTSA